jgi:hypothetical protein
MAHASMWRAARRLPRASGGVGGSDRIGQSARWCHHTRSDATLNSTTGEFATETLAEAAASGQFITRAYDVKFAATVSGTPTVIWYIGYDGNSAGGNVVKLRRAHIVMGQTRGCSPFSGDVDRPLAATSTTIADADSGLNIHRKFQGKQVYDSTNGKLRFALTTATTGAWRATDGSGDTTPS